jgi:hypothetical protein
MARKDPKPATPITLAMKAAEVVINRLPENCEYALSITNDCTDENEATLTVFTKDSAQYYEVTTDYRLAPAEMQRVQFRRGILLVQIFPPGLYE